MIDRDEWETLCLLIEEGWPGEFTDVTAKAWRVLLDDYDAKAVLVAIKALVAKGGTFRPSVAEVVATIRRDPSRPTFEEFYRLCYGRDGFLRATLPYTGPILEPQQRRDDAARARIAEMHPLVGSFVDRYGLAQLRLAEVDDPVYGDLRRKELREAWNRHCEAMEGREIAALASGRRDGLHAFDPLTALGRPNRAELEATNGKEER